MSQSTTAQKKEPFQLLLSKAVLYLADNWWIVLPIYILSLLFGGAVFYLVEHGPTFIQSVYWADTTAMTVGYGDISPKTTFGIIVYMVISKMWIWFLTPVIAGKIFMVLMVNTSAMTEQEQTLQLAYLENISRALGQPLYVHPHKWQDDEDWTLKEIETV